MIASKSVRASYICTYMYIYEMHLRKRRDSSWTAEMEREREELFYARFIVYAMFRLMTLICIESTDRSMRVLLSLYRVESGTSSWLLVGLQTEDEEAHRISLVAVAV